MFHVEHPLKSLSDKISVQRAFPATAATQLIIIIIKYIIPIIKPSIPRTMDIFTALLSFPAFFSLPAYTREIIERGIGKKNIPNKPHMKADLSFAFIPENLTLPDLFLAP